MDGVKELRRMLGELTEIEDGCERQVESARSDVADQDSYIQQLEAQLDAEREAKKRLVDRVELMEAARAAATVARERMEVLIAEAEKAKAPKVPLSNVTPIRPEVNPEPPAKHEVRVTAKVGLGAAVAKAKAKKVRKKKLTPDQEKKQKLKTTHVTGVMGFAGAEKPPHL